MAHVSRRRGKRPALTDSPDDEVNGASHLPSQDYESESSRRSHPRRRLSPDPSSDLDNDVGPSKSRRTMQKRPLGAQPSNGVVTNGGGSSPAEHSTGSIVRVKLQNFLTYTDAEYFPGPYLNMIIGANGTGKSSLLSAICLGLGFSPKIMGRQGNVSEFVKYGKDTCVIETELKHLPSDPENYVVRVQIRRETNSQKWWLNGQETPHKTIQALVRRLKIQVDNICQFLPQDRVYDFAKLSDVQLLEETLRAAAPTEVTNWHQSLKELHHDHREVNKRMVQCSEELERAQNRQQGLRGDVDRLREREEIQRQIELLGAALVAAEYNEAVSRHSAAKRQKKEAIARLRRLEGENEPSLQAVEDRRVYQRKVAAAVDSRERALRNAELAADKSENRVQNAVDKISEHTNRLAAQETSFKKIKLSVRDSRVNINKLQAQQRNEPKTFDAQDWTLKIRAEEHALREAKSKLDRIEASVAEVRSQNETRVAELKKVEGELESFKTQQGKQLHALSRLNSDAARGWEWVRSNRDKFKMEVFGPALLSCSVRDVRFTDHVQALLTLQDVTCFTTQCREDHLTLSHHLYKELGLSVSIRTCLATRDRFSAPIDAATTEALGLDGFAIDFLDGPSTVLAMLCSERRLHSTGVALRDISEAQYAKLESAESIPSWVAGRVLYRVTRRKEYGAAGKSVNTKEIGPARFWTDRPVDASESSQHHARIRTLHAEMAEFKDQFNQMKEEATEVKREMQEFQKRRDELAKTKHELQTEFMRWKGLPLKIEQENTNLERHLEEMTEARAQHRRILQDLNNARIAYVETALAHEDKIQALRGAYESLVEAQIRYIEAKSDVSGLENRAQDIVRQLEEEKNRLAEAERELQTMRAEANRLMDQVTQLKSDFSDSGSEFLELARGKTAQYIRDAIEAEENKLSLIHDAPADVLDRYNGFVRDVERLQKEQEAGHIKLGNLSTQIESLQTRWEPRVEELVGKINSAFSENFEQIGCAGEVRLHKEEDFDQWALRIMVNFRTAEGGPLVQLSGTHQSGGERSIATVFFLMSLESDAQAPFRAVDEINQGMDPRNERNMHNRMVDIACRKHGSQYFLITPKLLPGLNYDEKMTVLCIAAGPKMPKEARTLDFRRCARVQKTLLAGA